MALRYPSTFVELVAKPVPLSEDEMRAKFEAAIKAKYPHADFARHPDGKYQDYSAWDMWDGWQAAYKSMNEDK